MADAIQPRVRAVENMVKRAREKTRGDSGSPACPTCHVTLWLSFFFDGTGNNREKDFPRNHSNIAALYDAHEDDPLQGISKRYFEGLGTEFEFKERFEERRVYSRAGTYKVATRGYRETGDSKLGLGFANGISERLEKALFQFEEYIENRRAQTRVDAINFAAFGFSRGAAEARAFLHWLASHSKVTWKGSRLAYDGIPLRVKFLGLFDTVESVGMAGDNKMPDVIKTSIPPFVEKCTHLVAAHELRHAFPLTIGGHLHVVYPGAHADVGGGYAPNEQCRENTLSRVALLQMLDEARGAGLKMMSVAEMERSDRWQRELRPSFDVPKETLGALADYLAEVRPSGSLQQHVEAHMKHFWSWLDSGMAIEDATKKQASLPNSDANNRRALQRMVHMLTYEARTSAGRGLKPTTPVKGNVAPAVGRIFGQYVHDSFEHFSLTGGTLQTDLTDANYYKLRSLLQPSG